MPDKVVRCIFHNLLKVSMLIVLLVYSEFIIAKNLYTVGSEKISTSDGFKLNTIQFSYINNLRSHFWPYEELADSNYDWGVDYHHNFGKASETNFSAEHIEGVLGWRYSDRAYFRGKIGFHHLNAPSINNGEERLTYELDAHIDLTNDIYLNMNIADNYVYHFGMQHAGVWNYLSAKMWQVELEWQPAKTIRISGTTSVWKLSDTNTMQQTNLSVLYGIATDWPGIWAGISFEEMNYNKAMPDYWTPGDYHSIGLEFESNFPITGNLSSELSASLFQYSEDHLSKGNGDSIFVGLDYNWINNYTLKAGFYRYRSAEEGSDWSETRYQVFLNGTF